MYYSDDLIEEIRSKNDIVDVISSYVKLKKQGATYFGLCPFHNEKSPSFSVTPGKQMYYCFGCGEGGNVYSFIMKYENYTFIEAVKMLADKAGVTLPETEYSEEEKRKADLKATLLDINNESGAHFVQVGNNVFVFSDKSGIYNHYYALDTSGTEVEQSELLLNTNNGNWKITVFNIAQTDAVLAV